MKRGDPPEIDKENLLSLIEELYSSKAHFNINKSLLKRFGPEVAIYLTNLIDKLSYFAKRKMLKEDGSFFLTHKQQMEQTGIQSEHLLRKAKNVLKEEGILTTRMIGIPSKEFYNLNLLAFTNSLNPRGKEFRPLGVKNLDPLGSRILTNIKNNKVKNNKVKNNKTIKALAEFTLADTFLTFFPEDWLKNNHFRHTVIKYCKLCKEVRPNRPMTKSTMEYRSNLLIKHGILITIQTLESCIASGFITPKPEFILNKKNNTYTPNSTQKFENPDSILERHFGESTGKDSCGSPHQWMQSCITPLITHFNCEEEQVSMIAKGCCVLYDWYESKNQYDNAPSALTLVSNYIRWLSDDEQSWIKNISENLFNPSKTIFKRFMHYYEKEFLGYSIYSRVGL
jgi:hypothetical protein